MKARKKDIIKAWEEGCNDVKSTLETLYPEINFKADKIDLKYKVGDEVSIIVKVIEVDTNKDFAALKYPYKVIILGDPTDEAWVTRKSLEN